MGEAELPADLDTFPKLLARNARELGTLPAYREKEFGIWQSWTWAEAEAEIFALAAGLAEIGLQPGDHLAIIGRNRPYLYWAMVAAQACGAIPVPLYQDAVAEEMAYVLQHCGATVAVAADQEQVDKLLEAHEQAPDLRDIVYLDPRGLRRYDHSRLHAYTDVQARGRQADASVHAAIRERTGAQGADDTCVMLYTSGTTGNPKGVVLSNRNIIATARASAEFDHLSARDTVLAYLPLAWVGDFIFSMGQACWCGFCVNCPESPETMYENLHEIGPTYFFAPPRYFEQRITILTIRMEDAGAVKRWLFRTFMELARRVGPKILAGEPVGWRDRLAYRLGDVLIYGPVRDRAGMSRVRVAYTAGEAIGPEIFSFWRSLGINLKQLYGQTEASVFITQQPDGEVFADTVGVPSPGVELRIAESGEVFYRSPGVFVEYFKNSEATASTKDAEGWVATGDAGVIDPETGHLRIIDRAKDVGRLADGRLFAPKHVENRLKFHPNIREAVCFGHDRPYVSAMICMDLDSMGNWAERNNIGYASYQELAAHPQVYQMIQEDVEAANRSLAEDPMLSHCQIRRFLVLHKELDADDGELTRTMKVRRRTIAERYGSVIDAIYRGDDRVRCDVEVTYDDGRKGTISGILRIRDVETFAPAAAPSADRAA